MYKKKARPHFPMVNFVLSHEGPVGLGGGGGTATTEWVWKNVSGEARSQRPANAIRVTVHKEKDRDRLFGPSAPRVGGQTLPTQKAPRCMASSG